MPRVQEYVASLESTTQQQRRQLGQLKEEKRKADEVRIAGSGGVR